MAPAGTRPPSPARISRFWQNSHYAIETLNRFAFFALANFASVLKKNSLFVAIFGFFSLSLRFAIFSKIFDRFASLSLFDFGQNLHAWIKSILKILLEN